MSNVKAGDIAMIVAPYHHESLGRFVKVVRQAETVEQFGTMLFSDPTGYVLSWICKGRIKTSIKEHLIAPIADVCLIPIRRAVGEDETLAWAGKPSETPAEIVQRETSTHFPLIAVCNVSRNVLVGNTANVLSGFSDIGAAA